MSNDITDLCKIVLLLICIHFSLVPPIKRYKNFVLKKERNIIKFSIYRLDVVWKIAEKRVGDRGKGKQGRRGRTGGGSGAEVVTWVR